MSQNSVRAHGAPNKLPSTVWILAWGVGSVLPVAPYAAPLWQAALADSPYAYLLWIPIFAFAWGASALWRSPRYNDDGELNLMLALIPLLLAGGLFLFGMNKAPETYVGQSVGLLLWPVWSLGLAWLIFGVGVTRRLIRPLLYLLLAWPPLYTSIVSVTNPPLQSLADWSLSHLTGGLGWVRSIAPQGTYLVQHMHNWVPVYVSAVCSGSDSFLAMLILFPIVLVWFKGDFWKKILVIALGALLAIFANTARLVIIVAALHFWGQRIALGDIHPVLGGILFLLMVVLLSVFGAMIGLRAHPSVGELNLRLPRKLRSGVALVFTAGLTVLLWPLYFWSPGSAGVPLPVATNNLSVLMPTLPHFTRQLLGNYNDATLLGPGAVSTAFSYNNAQGNSVMAELWWTTNTSALQTYGVHNCLLFHGDSILNERSVALTNGLTATAFTVLAAPMQPGGPRTLYEDLAYPVTMIYNGQKVYVRVEIAAWVNTRNSSPGQVVQVVNSMLGPKAQANLPAMANLAYKNASSSPAVRTLSQYFGFAGAFSKNLLHASSAAESSAPTISAGA